MGTPHQHLKHTRSLPPRQPPFPSFWAGGGVELRIFENLWGGGTGREFSNRGDVVKSGGGIDTLYGLGDVVYTHGRSPNI